MKTTNPATGFILVTGWRAAWSRLRSRLRALPWNRIVPVALIALALAGAIWLGFLWVRAHETRVETLTRLAYAGDRKAQEDLAGVYFKGEEVPRNSSLGTAWLTVAYTGRKNLKGGWIDFSSRADTPQERAEIQRLATEIWRKVIH